jgi:hypothetical protein
LIVEETTACSAKAGITGGTSAHSRLFTVCVCRSFRTAASATRCAASKQIGFLFVVVFDFFAFNDDGIVIVFVYIFSAVPQAVAVILVDRPSTVFLVLFIFIGPLATTEASEIVGIIVLGEP